MSEERSAVISRLDAGRAGEAVPDLVELLADAVDDGASVGFVSPLEADVAEGYWRGVIAGVANGSVVLLAAHDGERVVGTVQLALASQPNGSHRAEVRRLLVHRSARRRGLGRALMLELESTAREMGRTLLTLNTRTGDPPEALYRSLGYHVVGLIPDFARNPDGTLNTTTIMYRQL